MDKESCNPEFSTKTWEEMLVEQDARDFQKQESRRRKLLKIKQAELEEDLEDGTDPA